MISYSVLVLVDLKKGLVSFEHNFPLQLSDNRFCRPEETRPAAVNTHSTGALDAGIERISKASDVSRG